MDSLMIMMLTFYFSELATFLRPAAAAAGAGAAAALVGAIRLEYADLVRIAGDSQRLVGIAGVSDDLVRIASDKQRLEGIAGDSDDLVRIASDKQR